MSLLFLLHSHASMEKSWGGAGRQGFTDPVLAISGLAQPSGCSRWKEELVIFCTVVMADRWMSLLIKRFVHTLLGRIIALFTH